MKRKMIITVGVSASGKSTWANDYCMNNPNTVIICRDNIRGVLFKEYKLGKYKYSKGNESKVTESALRQFEVAVHQGKNVIIADTNLNKKFREMWVFHGEDAGYEVEIKDFEITLEEAWKRDQTRGVYSVGREVISRQWKMWLEYSDRKVYKPDASKPKTILVDIDGTIADKGNRNPFDWSSVSKDTPRGFIIDLIKCYLNWYTYDKVIFLSGRDSICRHETLTWISSHMNIPIQNIKLLMRTEGDMRKDTLVKEELFWKYVDKNYNVVAVFDDRPCVIEMWYDIGIPNVISVADQRNRF